EYKTEKDAQRGIREVLKQGHRLVLVACSGQNIDRICSLYAEAQNAGYEFVIDPYVACVLENLKDLPYAGKIPTLASPGIRALIHNYGRGDKYVRLAVKKDSKFAGLIKLLGQRKLRPEWMKSGKYIVLVRDGIVPAIKAVPDYMDAFLVYSQWQGYLKKSHVKLTEFILGSGLDKNMKHIHSSGHADVPTLQRLVAALKPGKIIPVHTEHPEKYKELFPRHEIVIAQDGKSLKL
ncbi:MAG TPA: MBL fold metallo-hydrolase RNA specificity domain-containing protein, partial [Elusimicrobiales bacterium]|nr:MBL fold metallo-hydrolase RNA specificity domain-containing protein [Elusimicrobiales bacterium]